MGATNPGRLLIAVAALAVTYAALSIAVQSATHGAAPSTTTVYPQNNTLTAGAGSRIANFRIGRVNSDNVTGLLYRYYPVASTVPVPWVLKIGDTVGYACDGSLARLAGMSHGNATFILMGNGTKGPCPICLPGSATISTPRGPVSVRDIVPGTTVWTADASGNRRAAEVVRIGRTYVGSEHLMVRLVLADGRSVMASQAHPTADGRLVGSLAPGDTIDGSYVKSAELVQYNGTYTYDILPSGVTGYYWADGVLLGSTLK